MKVKFNHGVELDFVMSSNGTLSIIGPTGKHIADMHVGQVGNDDKSLSNDHFCLSLLFKDKSYCVAQDWAAAIFQI